MSEMVNILLILLYILIIGLILIGFVLLIIANIEGLFSMFDTFIDITKDDLNDVWKR